MAPGQPPRALLPAIEYLRQGDLAGARRAAEAALAQAPRDPELLGFAGFVTARLGDAAGAIPHFRALLDQRPGDLATRANLATALVAIGALDEAGTVAATHGGDVRLLRLGAWVHQQQGRLAEAGAGYAAAVAAAPDDFESWNNLGNVRAAAGDLAGAAAALQRAVALRPDIAEIATNLSEVLAKSDDEAGRQSVMRAAAARHPDNAKVQTELGLAESGARDFAAAEHAFRAAIRIDPRSVQPYLELGLLLENLNRVDDLAALVAEGEANGLDGPELGFLRAWALRRQGRHEEALPLAEATPVSIHPVRRAQLLAELYERTGDTPRAFAQFEAMNAAALATRPDAPARSYRAKVAADAALITPEQVGMWRPVSLELSPPAPIFIVGFPRSGTTLLDTLLMNLPSLHVLEELPVLSEVDVRLDGDDQLARLTGGEAQRLRAFYFEVQQRIAPGPAGATVVDKHPLHMTRMPVIHRIFPDTKVILVERHPCDAVLSCFMANFQLNNAMRSFTDLEEAARTYDTVFDAWTRAEAALPLQVHRVRYERMVADLEGELRPLLDFLGLPWDPKVLDNQASAAKRDHIRTASYSQVTEPIYKRAAGRWERYRDQLAPILPILAPWAERMGYDI